MEKYVKVTLLSQRENLPLRMKCTVRLEQCKVSNQKIL